MIYCLLNWSLQIFPTLFFYIPANPYSTMQQEGSSKNPNMIIIVLYLKHLMAVYRKRKFLNLQMVLFNIWPFFGFHTQFTPSSFVFSILQLQFHLNFFLSQTFLHTDFVFVSCLAATSQKITSTLSPSWLIPPSFRYLLNCHCLREARFDFLLYSLS